jgi:hypothetical protein
MDFDFWLAGLLILDRGYELLLTMASQLLSKAASILAFCIMAPSMERPVSLLFDFLAHLWPQFLDQSLIH